MARHLAPGSPFIEDDPAGVELDKFDDGVGGPVEELGSVFTFPLALGLYFALRPVRPALAATALTFRLLEAALGFLSSLTGFAAVSAHLAASGFGTMLLGLARWDDRTAFAAFMFTVGSTIFFYLFVRSRYIPPLLTWWGLFASVVALTACSAHLLRPAFPAMSMAPWVPALLAETSTGLWLLIKAVDVRAR